MGVRVGVRSMSQSERCCEEDVSREVWEQRRIPDQRRTKEREKESDNPRGSHQSCLVDGLTFLPFWSAPQRPPRCLCRQGKRITVDSLQGSSPDTRIKGVLREHLAGHCLDDEIYLSGEDWPT